MLLYVLMLKRLFNQLFIWMATAEKWSAKESEKNRIHHLHGGLHCNRPDLHQALSSTVLSVIAVDCRSHFGTLNVAMGR